MPHRIRVFSPCRLKAMLLGSLVFGALAATAACSSASELRQTPTVKIVQQAAPSIVNIHGQKTLSPSDEGYRRGEGPQNVNGMGTGVVIDPRGYILTNYHVVDGVKAIEVTMADKRTHTATLVARDNKTDLAVIKISVAKKLPVINIGTSSDLMVGEPVVAVGNAYGYDHSATKGIISALGRDVPVSDTQKYRDLIQTDASINPGNSGGPLFNADGEMIGINVAVRAGAQGIGFAIPVDQAMTVATNLMGSSNPWHGIIAKPSAATVGKQLVVGDVDQESPAGMCGLRAGDVITTIDENPIVRPLDVERALLGHKSGEEVEVTVERQGRPMTVSMVLGRPQKQSDKIWDILGLQLAEIPAKEFGEFRTADGYRGGLRVTSVRMNGAADREGIHIGDVIVGMHNYETLRVQDVEKIMRFDKLPKNGIVNFLILRDEGGGFVTYQCRMQVTARR